MIAPTLTTERLTLRMPRLADFEPRAAHAASDRSIHEGGPVGRIAAWRIFASDVGQWSLLGYGPFSVDERTTGAYVGEVGVYHAADYPEPELGWFVLPDAEGKGYVAEAARAVLYWAHRTFGWERLVSYIDPENARSIALARRLGGIVDPSLPGQDPTDIVFRHDIGGRP